MKAALQKKSEITSSTSSDPRMKALVLLAETKTTTYKFTSFAPHKIRYIISKVKLWLNFITRNPTKLSPSNSDTPSCPSHFCVQEVDWPATTTHLVWANQKRALT